MFSISCVVVTASAVSNVVAPSRMTKTMMCSPVPECHVTKGVRSKSACLAS